MSCVLVSFFSCVCAGQGTGFLQSCTLAVAMVGGDRECREFFLNELFWNSPKAIEE